MKIRLFLFLFILFFLGQASNSLAANCSVVTDYNLDYYYQCDGNQITGTAKHTLGDKITDFTVANSMVFWVFYDGLTKTTANLSVSLSLPFVNLAINSNTSRYDLFTAAGSPSSAVNVTLRIGAGATVSGTYPTNPAIYASKNFPAGSELLIINEGSIRGQCGSAYSIKGYNGYAGSDGGDAIRLPADTIIYNLGSIYSGGGGGGGGGTGQKAGNPYNGGLGASLCSGAGGAGGAPQSIPSEGGPNPVLSGRGGAGGSSNWGSDGGGGGSGTCTSIESYRSAPCFYNNSTNPPGVGGAGGKAGYVVKTNNFHLCVKGASADNFKGPVSGSYNDSSCFSEPTLSFFSNPSLVSKNGTSLLSWFSTETQSCVASGDWSGTKSTSGSAATTPINVGKIYNLSCTGLNGSVVSASTSVGITCEGNKIWFSDIQWQPQTLVSSGLCSDDGGGNFNCSNSPYSSCNSDTDCDVYNPGYFEDYGYCIPFPTPLYVSVDNDCDPVALSWSDVSEATYYEIYKNGDLVDGFGGGRNSWIDQDSYNLIPGNKYDYTLVLYDDVGHYSVDNFPTIFVPSYCPTTPNGLTVNGSASPSCNSVSLKWDSQSEEDYKTFNLYRDDNLLASDIKTHSYIDSDVSEGETHYYGVQTCASNTMCSSKSDYIEVNVPLCEDIKQNNNLTSTCLVSQTGSTGKIYVNKETKWEATSTLVNIPSNASTTWKGTDISQTPWKASTILNKIYTTVGIKDINATSTWIENGVEKTATCSTTINVIFGDSLIREI